MNAATITKTLKALKLENGPESFGFKRYMVLPNDVKFNLKVAHLLETGNLEWVERVAKFFENMTEQEYINWMKFNAR